MLLKRILNHRFILIFLFIVAFLGTRVPGLGTDVINPDGVNWHYRSQQFYVGLKTGQLEKTYQHYHPGVTLMWVSGAGIEIIKQVFPEEAVYNHINFLTYHFVAKFFLISAQLTLSVIIFFLLNKIFKINDVKRGVLIAFLATLTFSLEPFFVGNSRLLHLDILLSLFLLIGLLFSYLSVIQYKYYYVLGAGVFMSLAFLTKSIAIGGLLFNVVICGWLIYSFNGVKKFINYELFLIGAFLITTVLIFPAMWKDPVYVITEIFSEAERVGIRKGHGQIVLGEYTRDAGIAFYFLVLLIKVSIFTLLGSVLFFISRLLDNFRDYKNRSPEFREVTSFVKNKMYSSLCVFLGVFYIGYLVISMIPTKKIDRYMIPLYPFLAITAIFGYFNVYNKISEKLRKFYLPAIYLIFVVFVLVPVAKFHPYQFTYSSPIVGSPESAHRIVAQKPFGVAIPELRDFIFDRYSNFPKIGFIDTKPMGSIYMNSRIFDARINGPSDYELLILGVNEEVPENAISKDFVWEKNTSLYVNGLEYWKVYVKRSN
jgi:hypothetical protein